MGVSNNGGKNMWTVKGIKRWDGMEGVGTECSLYRDGKKVARVLD